MVYMAELFDQKLTLKISSSALLFAVFKHVKFPTNSVSLSPSIFKVQLNIAVVLESESSYVQFDSYVFPI